MKVLIVDDSEAPLKFLEKVITELGHEVVAVAHNGEEAVERFRQFRPDAVFMDVIMPRMNGLEALQAIRSADPQARIVMTCSLKSCDMAFASEEQGARYFLTKPFQEDRLRKILCKLAGEVSDAGAKHAGQHPPAACSTPQDPASLDSIRRTRPARQATVN